MSAFMVSAAHVDYLVSAASLWRCWAFLDAPNAKPETPETLVGRMLLETNADSVAFRYRQDKPNGEALAYRFKLTLDVRPVQVLKAISCLAYQSCEHAAWETSEAKRFCDSLKETAIGRLPGYAESAWEIRDRAKGPAPKRIF